MKTFNSAHFLLPLCLGALIGASSGLGAVSFTVTPAAVSNTYNGTITLQVAGLGAGDSVVVQKFLDLNRSGQIDAGEFPVQQFKLTDGQAGMVIGGVTNSNVPGDSNPAAGQITATMAFNNGDFIQTFVGQYLFKVSSPAGSFTPITNLFTVTNFPFPQKFTGTVLSNGSTALPNAVVLLFPPPRPGHGLGAVQAATVADNSGNYVAMVPAGSYALFAGKSNFLADTSVLPVLALGAGATVATNLSLVGATSSISGSLVDANNSSVGLPGISMSAQSSGNLLGIGFTDTNGNYTLGVQAGPWQVSSIDGSLIVSGYVQPDNKTNAVAGSSGVVIGYQRATALFYGSVKDNLGNPMPGIDINAGDYNGGLYDLDLLTDANGNYTMGIVGGLGGGDPWSVDIGGGDGEPVNYVYSQAPFNQNGGTNVSGGQAVAVNFVARLATNQITGNVTAGGTNLAGVGVSASATINGTNYNADANTDANGNYSLNVAGGNWSVGVDCQGGDGSLDGILGGGSYACPNNQNVNLAGNNGTANFAVALCNTVEIITTNLPPGQVNAYYDQFLQGASCSGLGWSLNDPQDFPAGLSFASNGEISGMPAASGTFNFSVHVYDNNCHEADQGLSLVISSATPDVLVYYVAKAQDFVQTNASTLVPDTFYGPFSAYSGIVQSALGRVSIANVTLPTSSVKGFPSGNSAIELQVRETFASQSAIDAAYPAGSYSFAISAQDDGNQFPVLNLPSAPYPNGPRVSNFAAAQAVNPNLPFLLQWDAFAGGTINDAIWFYVQDGLGDQVFSTPHPSTDPADALPGTATSATVPAGTLQPGSNYTGVVVFIKLLAANTSSYPGAFGGTFAETENTFALTTLSGSPSLGQPARGSGSQFGLNLSGLPGSTYTVLSATNLTTPLSNWFTVAVTNLPSSPVLIQDNQATNRQRFYRARLGP